MDLTEKLTRDLHAVTFETQSLNGAAGETTETGLGVAGPDAKKEQSHQVAQEKNNPPRARHVRMSTKKATANYYVVSRLEFGQGFGDILGIVLAVRVKSNTVVIPAPPGKLNTRSQSGSKTAVVAMSKKIIGKTRCQIPGIIGRAIVDNYSVCIEIILRL